MTVVSIVAPSDLTEGYILQVEVDGKLCEIACPYDLKMGETLEGMLKNCYRVLRPLTYFPYFLTCKHIPAVPLSIT